VAHSSAPHAAQRNAGGAATGADVVVVAGGEEGRAGAVGAVVGAGRAAGCEAPAPLHAAVATSAATTATPGRSQAARGGRGRIAGHYPGPANAPGLGRVKNERGD